MESSDFVKLNWDSTKPQIIRNLKQIWNDQSFTDVTLAFDDEVKIQTNRTLLAAISPILRGATKSITGHNSCIFLFGLKSSSVKSLLEFVYKEEISIEKNKLENFLSTAQILKINGFIEPNEDEHKNVEISPSNVSEESIDIKEDNYDIEDYVPVLQTDTEEFWNVETSAVDTHDDGKLLAMNPQIDSPTRAITSVDSKADILSTLTELHPPQETTVEKKETNGRITIDEEISGELRCNYPSCKPTSYKPNVPTFASVADLNEHLQVSHTPTSTKSYKCDQCDSEFPKQLALKTHIRKEHTPKIAGSISCDVCGKSFKTVAKLATHCDYSHPVPGRMFKCKLCPKESRTKNSSNVHYYQAHTELERKAYEDKIKAM